MAEVCGALWPGQILCAGKLGDAATACAIEAGTQVEDIMLRQNFAVGNAAITAEGTFERSMEQRDIKRAAYERSKAKVLIADKSKFSCSAPFFTAPLSSFDKIVSNAAPNEEFLSAAPDLFFF